MNHLKQIAEKLPEYGLDAMLITSEPGERYAIGFHGEGLLLVTREEAHYTTDGRYIEAAQEQIQGADVKLITPDSGHLAQARAFLEERGLHNVGFESGNVTVDAHRRYSQELPCILTPAQQLLDGLRASKDEEELAVMRHAQEITDGAFKAVLDFIRPGMTEREIAARLRGEAVLSPYRGCRTKRFPASRRARGSSGGKWDVHHHGLWMQGGGLLL